VTATVAASQERPLAAPALPALEAALNTWRQDWQSRNANAYLDWYADDFTPAPPMLSRAQWKAQRLAVFAKPAVEISITIGHLELSQTGALDSDSREALVEFDQVYRASNHADQGHKTMRWRWQAGQWRILSERFRACTAKQQPAGTCLVDAKD
jgi:ketosteroid isomerase-like protein